MKGRTIHLLSVVALALVFLCLAAAGVAKPKAKGRKVTSTEEIDGYVMAGVGAARMQAEHTEVLFETILGVELAGYREAETLQELLYELRSGRADVICCSDVVAEYLLKTEEDLVRLTAPEDRAGGVEGGGRLSFAMAMAKGKNDLKNELDAALTELETEGVLEALAVAYVEADVPLELYQGKKDTEKETLYVGVTGTVPPLDLLDEYGRPCGFSVAFLQELEKRTEYCFEPVYVTPKESFTFLNSGKIDLLFSYGTSKNTTPGEKDYLVTKGYYTMDEYAYLVLK